MSKPRKPSSKRQATPRPDPSPENPVEVIVKVKEADYVPEGVAVRAQVSPLLFTSVVPADDLTRLENDPKVHSVSVSSPLRTVG